MSLFSNCRKDVSACRHYQQAEQEKLVDSATIQVPEFRSLLAQHAYLKPYEFNDDTYSSVMKCYVYFKGLPVLTDQYVALRNKTTNEVTLSDTLRSYDLPLSTEPGISYSDAIKEARKVADFDHTCMFYSLAVFNTELYRSFNSNHYALVWKIEGKKGYPLVIIDAHTKQVYRNLDGIIVN